MADTVTVSIPFNGSHRAIYKLTGVSDGTGESLVKKVNLADLTDAHYGVPSEVIIQRIEYSIYGESVELFWEGTPNLPMVVLEGHDDMDFIKFGGLKNNAASPTGNILLSTNNATSGAIYSIIIEMIQHYANSPGIS
jgi:hypothetical protein